MSFKKLTALSLFLCAGLLSIPFFYDIKIERMPSECNYSLKDFLGKSYDEAISALYVKAFKLELNGKHMEAKNLSDCLLIILHKPNGWDLDISG